MKFACILAALVLAAVLPVSLSTSAAHACSLPRCGAGGGGVTLPSSVICNTSQTSWAWQQADDVPVLSKANGFDTSGQQFCIKASGTWQQPGPPGFQVISNLRYTGKWQAYPFTGVGCAYNLCSRNTDLPRQVSRLPSSATTSFAWQRNGATGSWNASYDIWLDDSKQIRTENDGAEVMIWLRPNTGLNSHFHLAWVGGRLYWWITWRVCDNAGICWNYVQFRFTGPWFARHGMWFVLQSAHQLHLMPFLQFLERQGLVRSSWYLTSVHAGYEIVSGGKGLTTTWFSTHI